MPHEVSRTAALRTLGAGRLAPAALGDGPDAYAASILSSIEHPRARAGTAFTVAGFCTELDREPFVLALRHA